MPENRQITVPPMILEWWTGLRSTRIQLACLAIAAILWAIDAPLTGEPAFDASIAGWVCFGKSVGVALVAGATIISLAFRRPKPPDEEAANDA